MEITGGGLIGLIFGLLVLFWISVWLALRKRIGRPTVKERLAAFELPAFLLKSKPSETLVDALSQYFNQSVQQQIKERLEYESQTTRGEPVWVSYYVRNDQMKRWALITHSHKYELRLVESNPEEGSESIDLDLSIRVLVQSGVFHKRTYDYNIKPYTVDEERRARVLKAHFEPCIGDIYVSMIGWTKLTKDEIDEVCRTTMHGIGSYNLFWNNCQLFLRHIACKIVAVRDRGQDWQWLMSNASRSDPFVMQPQSPVKVVAMKHVTIHRMKQFLPQIDEHERTILERNIAVLESSIRSHEINFVGEGQILAAAAGSTGASSEDSGWSLNRGGDGGDSGGGGDGGC